MCTSPSQQVRMNPYLKIMSFSKRHRTLEGKIMVKLNSVEEIIQYCRVNTIVDEWKTVTTTLSKLQNVLSHNWEIKRTPAGHKYLWNSSRVKRINILDIFDDQNIKEVEEKEVQLAKQAKQAKPIEAYDVGQTLVSPDGSKVLYIGPSAADWLDNKYYMHIVQSANGSKLPIAVDITMFQNLTQYKNKQTEKLVKDLKEFMIEGTSYESCIYDIATALIEGHIDLEEYK